MVKNLCLPLEPKDVKGFVHDLHLLDIVDGLHLDLAQAAGRIVCAKGECQTKSNCQTRHVQRLTFRFGNISVSRLLPFFFRVSFGRIWSRKKSRFQKIWSRKNSLCFEDFGLSLSGHVTSDCQTKSNHQKSQIIKQSQIVKKKFTVDVVTQLAQLVQVDDMGDEEVEHVVTSLASLTIKIKT